VSAYLTISVGTDTDGAEPLLVTDDPAVLGAAVEALLRRLGRPDQSESRPASQ